MVVGLLYDLVAAAPTPVLFLKRRSLTWPAGMTLLLAANLASFPSHLLPVGLLRHAVEAFTGVYIPLLVLACLGWVIWLEEKAASQAHDLRVG